LTECKIFVTPPITFSKIADVAKENSIEKKKSFDLQFVPFGSLHNMTVIFVIYTGRYKIGYIITLSYY
jgi:hypothetical protein